MPQLPVTRKKAWSCSHMFSCSHVLTWSRFLFFFLMALCLQQREAKLQLAFVICSLHCWNHLSYSVLDAWLIVSGSGSGLFWDWIKIKDQIKARLGSGYYILSSLHTLLSQKKKREKRQQEMWPYHWSQTAPVSHQKDHRSADVTPKGGLHWISHSVRNSGWASHSGTAVANHVHSWKTDTQHETAHWSIWGWHQK